MNTNYLDFFWWMEAPRIPCCNHRLRKLHLYWPPYYLCCSWFRWHFWHMESGVHGKMMKMELMKSSLQKLNLMLKLMLKLQWAASWFPLSLQFSMSFEVVIITTTPNTKHFLPSRGKNNNSSSQRFTSLSFFPMTCCLLSLQFFNSN